ncbi:MAG: hypothetical protein A3C30_01855 [Candidatus Levybacteria bacterium RIFCSPHIGHO2_02_FULL_40_18]|nr:MAG: hypothetical protein A2869_04235 [Candidatus Levybacteria bacterium RIFCSPHIGHO2_01_FULL_40_58]OGH26735.1 MAG: hypothetical protein A3C30_01855 [Candidatus Levybacteria bacterium RIFCSPHIGHO2_02_FULL_40_18]OGH31670.1 MAG: hypothetical protein A3E43_01575 [Candidatus Levybacteria bacterium RIFCSPHIGHO2_12_FULL_40_31]OGH40570.1 MAG: hypothetical protein A2894_00125 [Candidatus Levybacteria bacterium RIFCSPLOWO2_01_FULL_40_64]OGH53289.1 MAG: hypothetical protein A3G15_04690 [Candidatus Lev
MNLSVGIIGLPNVGKSTLFNALLKKQAALAANYPFATIEPNVGVVPVPDERLVRLAEITKEEEGMASSPPIKPATVEFVDIAGLVKGASEGAGLGNKFLSYIRKVRIIAHVVRVFEDPNVVKEGSVDPKSDYEIVRTELALSDLDSKGDPLAEKPEIIVLNVSEGDYNPVSIKRLTDEYSNLLETSKDKIIVISAKIEEELATLSDEEQKQYLADLGLKESGLERLIKKAYSELGLISFLTCGEKEVRAWTIRAGTNAQNAAGEIHTDFIKNFIKAEIVSYEDFIANKGWKGSRAAGKARLEGKDYIVNDGDVIEFKIGR